MSHPEKFKLIASVYLLFRRDEEILLLRRFNTGYEDGNYGLVAGHLDAGESLRHATVREAYEESGVVIKEEDLILRTTMHRKQDDERVDFFFEPTNWSGEITNMEPGKCDDLSWFRINDLPENIIPYIRQAIECADRGIIYSEFGWNT
jgi:8-oxo-dGTP diphosphatase